MRPTESTNICILRAHKIMKTGSTVTIDGVAYIIPPYKMMSIARGGVIILDGHVWDYKRPKHDRIKDDMQTRVIDITTEAQAYRISNANGVDIDISQGTEFRITGELKTYGTSGTDAMTTSSTTLDFGDLDIAECKLTITVPPAFKLLEMACTGKVFIYNANLPSLGIIMKSRGVLRIIDSKIDNVDFTDCDVFVKDLSCRAITGCNSGMVNIQAYVDTDITIKGASDNVGVNATVGGEVSINTMSGDIRYIGVASSGSLNSMSGDITYAGVINGVKLHTMSGNIKIKDGYSGDVNASTMSGDVIADGEYTGAITASTMNGSIRGKNADLVKGNRRARPTRRMTIGNSQFTFN